MYSLVCLSCQRVTAKEMVRCSSGAYACSAIMIIASTAGRGPRLAARALTVTTRMCSLVSVSLVVKDANCVRQVLTTTLRTNASNAQMVTILTIQLTHVPNAKN